ncbi:hypothetical protein Cgig2_030139 [Carnegiea gigantea]|uniref:Reverse transcriptase n=1 Tax=Carnegiea gigantea TaxID=171969 RepID=A0A9Q1JZY4_9CARY|nr:hypothetical protein Cgig2_030139 [Carnegiea gigantea]
MKLLISKLMEGLRSPFASLLLSPTSSTSSQQSFRKHLWNLEIPLKMTMLAWRACQNALPVNDALAHKIKTIDAKCDFCGEIHESDMHAQFDCPQASSIWRASSFFDFVQAHKFRTVVDAIDDFQRAYLSSVEDLVAIMRTLWNSRNEGQYKQSTLPPRLAISRALNYVRDYKEALDHFVMPSNASAARIGRDSHGVVLFMATKQSSTFTAPDEEEAHACFLALKQAWMRGFTRLIVERDCLTVILQLKANGKSNSSLDLILDAILSFSKLFFTC